LTALNLCRRPSPHQIIASPAACAASASASL
jgi:hypothetical protein